MSVFTHNPNLDDSGDDHIIHTYDGLTLHITPSRLTVYDKHVSDTEPVACLPIHLGDIVGVVASDAIYIHAPNRHTLTLRRNGNELHLRHTHHKTTLEDQTLLLPSDPHPLRTQPLAAQPKAA